MIIRIIIITHFHCLIVPLSVQTIQNENKHFCSIVIFKNPANICAFAQNHAVLCYMDRTLLADIYLSVNGYFFMNR